MRKRGKPEKRDSRLTEEENRQERRNDKPRNHSMVHRLYVFLLVACVLELIRERLSGGKKNKSLVAR